MKQRWTLASAASLIFLMGSWGGSVYALAPAQAAQTPQPAPRTDRQEVSGRIEAVDADRSTLTVRGTSVPIVTTAATRYARGLTFETLKPGMAVRIVAVLRSDGKLEALEVRNA